jgi:ABC-type antimicrobial peptide transport system permease subunit
MISYLLSFVSKYGVVFFLIFSAIILMNFINSSIKFRKKEIGTLRALGCRSKDIVTMFLYESIILMVVALVIAFILIPKIINSVNGFVIKQLLINLNVLSFGITQVLEITGIMLIIVILANVMPVRRITKMKPIDAILNK